jgi:hypothetical protein
MVTREEDASNPIREGREQRLGPHGVDCAQEPANRAANRAANEQAIGLKPRGPRKGRRFFTSTVAKAE